MNRTTWRIAVDGQIEIVDVPAGWALVSQSRLDRLQWCADLLSDLDRSPNGRHQGDSESQDRTGRSQGNPFLVD
jgi:hypothetical protein